MPPDASRVPALALLFCVAVGLAGSGCTKRTASESSSVVQRGSCSEPGVRDVVVRFGQALKQVSLLAPASEAELQIRRAYGPLVTPGLLRTWLAQPSLAPGRRVSSPWPERIEILSVEPGAQGMCRVRGEIIHVTSVELERGGAAQREPVTIGVLENGGWRIASFAAGSETALDSTSAAAAVEVIRRYYAAIDARDFGQAYAAWEGDGRASGQTFAEFAAGFSETARVQVDIGQPGRIEPAAGSRYVSVPVTVRAVTKAGETQRFTGTYARRRAVVEGATPDQRRWHIHSASVRRE
jgi:hypothetical protein